MPTENRSSNTEMVSVPREQLDKWETCLLAHDLHGIADEVRALLAQPAAPHQGEPVAEIVMFGEGLKEVAWKKGKMPDAGTRLYTRADSGEVARLRNEHAEAISAGMRYQDQCETLRAQLEARHQGEPVAWRGLNELGEVVTDWIDGTPPESIVDLCGNPASFARIEQAYAHADTGEVERLNERLRLEKARGELLNDARVKAEELQWAAERKLAERDALLRNSAEVHGAFAKDIEADKRGREQPKWLTEAELCMRYMSHRINAALSASAEPKS